MNAETEMGTSDGLGAPTAQRARYEVPALIVVDAVDRQDAWTRARNLSATLSAEEGPGAFFCEIGVAATNEPRSVEDLDGRETVGEHVESVRAAVGDDWVWQPLRLYTVIGTYTEDGQRFCEEFSVRGDHEAAERAAVEWAEAESSAEITIAGVVEGPVTLADAIQGKP